VGTLNPKKNTLDVPVPALPSTTITDFKTTVEKSYKAKVHGKKKTFNYASAKCSHKKLTLKGKFVYSDGESTDTPSTKAKCST